MPQQEYDSPQQSSLFDLPTDALSTCSKAVTKILAKLTQIQSQRNTREVQQNGL